MRRAQPGDAAALLIDEDRGIQPADAGAQLGDEATYLRGIDAIALEEDEAERIGPGEERALPGRQRHAGAAEDRRPRRAHVRAGQ
jgi:hypothetical protein